MKSLRQIILDVAYDQGGKFVYYDRKESESLPMGEIERAIKEGLVTTEEIATEFLKGAAISYLTSQ